MRRVIDPQCNPRGAPGGVNRRDIAKTDVESYPQLGAGEQVVQGRGVERGRNAFIGRKGQARVVRKPAPQHPNQLDTVGHNTPQLARGQGPFGVLQKGRCPRAKVHENANQGRSPSGGDHNRGRSTAGGNGCAHREDGERDCDEANSIL